VLVESHLGHLRFCDELLPLFFSELFPSTLDKAEAVVGDGDGVEGHVGDGEEEKEANLEAVSPPPPNNS